MGHDIHFLSRLNRLALPHVELAMSLYNDTPMLRFILDSLELPDGVERVALSLADQDAGPFLVVQRDGHFVTCLGEGMAPVGLQIIPRSHLSALALRVESLRDRLEVARKLKGPNSRVTDLFRPLMVAGPSLAREDFVGAAACAPLLPAQIFSLIRDLHEDLRLLANQLRSAHKLRAAKPETLRAYWNAVWAIGHLTLLLGMEGRSLWEEVASKIDEPETPMTISWPAVRQGLCAVALRGAWAAGKIGKSALAGFKAQYHGGGSDLIFYNAALGLLGLAVRHKGLRGEIRKALQHEVPLESRGPCGVLFKVATEQLPLIFEETLRLADEDPEALTHVARQIYFERVQSRLREGSPFRFADAQEVPSELAAPAYASMPFILIGDVGALPPLFFITAMCARLEAEALYFPREFHKDYHLPYHPFFVTQLLSEMHALYGTKQPSRAAQKPGRNDLCPCGSGIKHKKCCALKQPA